MSTNSTIEWTENTWNPVTGCQRVSPGCQNCYAERFARRLAAMGQDKYKDVVRVNSDGNPQWTGVINIHEEALKEPYRWKSPRKVFVNSMSDLFHDNVPVSFIREVAKVMANTPQHIYQILTKRPERLVKISKQVRWSHNVWIGVSVENRDYFHRIDQLRKVDVKVRFLSLEPLLGGMPDLNLQGIHWVIVGGESGPGARPMREEWVHDIKEQCAAQNVPFFFKQWGGINKKKAGRLLDGMEYNDMPEHLPTKKKVA